MCWSRTESRLFAGWKPLALAAACLAPAGCVSGPLQAVRSTAQKTSTGPDTTQSIANLVELTAHDTIGPDLEYRVSEQYVGALQTLEVGGTTSHQQVTQNRPSAEMMITQGPIRWTQRFEYLDNRSQYDPGADNHLVRTDLLEKVEWSPWGMPKFTGWLDYRTVQDEFYVDQSLLDALLQVEQQSDAFDYQYTWQGQKTDDLRSGVGSDRDDNTLRATWRQDGLSGKLNSTVSVFANDRRSTLDGATSSSPGVEVFPLQGYSILDLTPQISTLLANPALIDTNDSASAGINIGGFSAGGEPGWNIGVRLPPGATIDTLLMTTVDEVSSTEVGQFSFSVWASQDNTFWTPVSSSASYVYDAVSRNFRFTIPPVSQPYLKVVATATPPTAPAVLVSELRIFTAAAVTGTRVDSHDATQNATANLSWHVLDNLTLGYDLFLQNADSETESTVTRDETRVDNGLWALWNPDPKVDTSVRISDQETRDPVVQDETLQALTGVVSYHPIERLDVSTSYTNTQRQVNGIDDTTTWVAQGLVSARLLDTLRSDITVEHSNQDDYTNQRLIDHSVLGIAFVAQLEPRLELTLGVRDDQADVTGAGAAGIPNPSETRTQMIWLYRPSEQLTAQFEFDWVDNYTGSGLDQRTRIDWIPFERGSLDVQFDLDRVSTESYTQSQMDRMRILTRYTITPRAFLEFSYSVQDPSDAPRTEILSLAFNFSS